MSLEATLDIGTLNRQETQHFSGTVDKNWSYHGTSYTKYENGRTIEQNIGISINAGAVKGPTEAKLIVEVTRKKTDNMGGLGNPCVDAQYNGPIYDKKELLQDPSREVMSYFFKQIAPAIDAKLDSIPTVSDMRFGIAAKLYE